MALRFANSLFEPLWNSARSTMSRSPWPRRSGVEERVGYYDKSGALRDMVQNHILQLLCLVAMEPPAAFDADAVRDEKLKVLRSLKPIAAREVATDDRARPVPGRRRRGQAVPGYPEELGGHDSDTETFVALKAEVENWRWAGVPFYLRTGKRLPARASPRSSSSSATCRTRSSREAGRHLVANRLVIRLQPDEGMKL